MPIPDFTRAEYVRPEALEGDVVGVPRRAPAATFPIALIYGAGAAIAGAVGYALVSLTHIMVSIVALGMGWLIAKAMMTATKGIGGRPYQVAACILTYFSVTLGQALGVYWQVRNQVDEIGRARLNAYLTETFIAGPFLGLQRNGFSGAIGLLILFIGMRAAWQLAAGGDARYSGLFGRR